jgi:hypothetical protein
MMQMQSSVLDLVLAGTGDAILMIEGFCDFLTEEQMLVALKAGHGAVQEACRAIADWCGHAHSVHHCVMNAATYTMHSLTAGRLK